MSDARFLTASGPSLFDAAFLGEAGGAWWVGVVRRAVQARMPLDIGVRLASKQRLTGLWRSPSGQLWVCGEEGVRRNPDPWGQDGAEWTQQNLDADLTGITGLSDTCVIATGIRGSDGHHVLRHWNGAKWNGIATPGFPIRDLHVNAPDDVWIAGDGIAHWDGTGLQVLDLPGFVAIAAPSADRVLAVHRDGRFGRVTPEGFAPLGQIDGACTIAVWNDRIWIGAGENGLWRAGGGETVCVREDRYCIQLEAHPDGLLIACSDLVSSTADGERFPGGCRGTLDGRSLD